MLNHIIYFISWDYRNNNDYNIPKHFVFDLSKYRMEDVNEN